jgi:sugar-specific transcriptional regulator TrmB
MDTDLINLLQKTGFTEKEAKIYLALLELGQGDVTSIAKSAGLKRSIVYVLVDELIEKGYVSMLPNRKINTYQAIDPGIILTQIKATTKNFSEMLPFFRSLHNKGDKKPKLHYIENREGILKIYEEMNNHNDQFFLSSYSRLEDCFPGIVPEWIKNYKNRRYNFIARHLLSDSPHEIEYAKQLQSIGQKIRISSELKNIKMDFTLYGNKLALTSLEEKPFIVLIESEELVNSMKPIFEIAWRSGKELS